MTRALTEAEKRAFKEFEKVALTIGFDAYDLEANDVLVLVRAVIRSLHSAPHDLLDIARGDKMASGDAALFVNRFIDAASPEIEE